MISQRSLIRDDLDCTLNLAADHLNNLKLILERASNSDALLMLYMKFFNRNGLTSEIK